jgi:hypothetical protein
MQGRLLLGLLALSTAAAAQVMDGQLRVKVHDPSGRAVPARVELAGRNPPSFAEALADAEGEGVLRRLAPGVYQLRVAHNGLADFTRTVEIRSSVPQTIDVALQLGVVQSEITVRDAAPLLDPAQPSIVMHAGRSRLEQALGFLGHRSEADFQGGRYDTSYDQKF